ncbi:hypothetical protein TrCOL_g13459 [Triparma columacea]|uniref:Uncharacterized protein n=1 Tax=Triparma columacea TaxID=722753 RepID=A0A9W7GGZ5_9STRA|nr:hypothetical protein TrCOL_g13459 [Triparma columacea]
MTNQARSHNMKYGKIVDMSYLAKKLTSFFLGASFLLIDLLSDTYFCVSLYHDESYADVSTGRKHAFLAFLVLSTTLWILSSFVIALSFKSSVGFHDQPSALQKIILLLCLTALVAFDLPMYLLAMPQRTVLVTDVRRSDLPTFSPSRKSPSSPSPNSPSSPRPPISNSLFVLGYSSRSEWKASTHYGLFSHLPTFLFEDIPLFIINAQISLSASVSFTSVLALIFSLFGIFRKGWTIYNFCREGFASQK